MQQEIKLINNNFTNNLVNEIKYVLTNTLQIKNIEKAHELLSENPQLVHMTDQDTLIHKKFYNEVDNLESKINKLYRNLAENICDSFAQNPKHNNWAIQRFPSLRVQFPNNVSVFEFHKDSYYAHYIDQVNNFWR